MNYIEYKPSPVRVMTYSEIARIQSFRRKHRIGFVQLFALLALAVITPVVLTDYAQARMEENKARAAFVMGSEGDVSR